MTSWYAQSKQSAQGIYLWNLTQTCGKSLIISNMIQYEWFDWAVFDLVFTAFLLSGRVIGASRDKRLSRILSASFLMAQELTIVYMACCFEWGPSCGRWYLLQTARLTFRNYWTFFGKNLVAVLALFLINRARLQALTRRNKYNCDNVAFDGNARFYKTIVDNRNQLFTRARNIAHTNCLHRLNRSRCVKRNRLREIESADAL